MDTTPALLRALAPRRLLLASLLLGAAFITWTSLPYFSAEDLHPFVIEKLPSLRFEALWLRALDVHVATALVALPACVLLLSRTVLRRAPRAHRILGRVTGVLLLVLLVPSGSVLAFEAKGGALGTAGFLLSGLIIAVATVQGVRSARARALEAHRHAMHHVLAQMSVAVTSRALLIALDASALSAEAAYLLALWLPVLGSALLVEALRSRTRSVLVPARAPPLPFFGAGVGG